MKIFKMIRCFFITQLIFASIIFSLKVCAQEKVMMTTDRYIYIAGESLWFNVGAYQLDANLPSELSQVVYIELINNRNVPVLQVKCSIDRICAQSQFAIPDSLSTGIYSLRAYTRWMQNKDHSLFAKKEISIINPFIAKPLPQGDKYSISDTIFTYPEGGILFPEVENKVVLRAFSPLGEGKAIEGYLVDSENKNISTFRTDDKGYGLFKFVPEKGEVYFYCFDDIRIKLPPVSDKKRYLQLINQDSEFYTFKIHGRSEKNVWLDIVSQDGKFIRRYSVSADGIINVKVLSEFVFYALLVDDNENVLAYRAFSSKKNEHLIIPKFRSDKQFYGRREKVNLIIDRIGTLKDVSISVVKSCLLRNKRSQRNSVSLVYSDALIALNPPFFLANNRSNILLPEVEGELVTGMITNKETGKPIIGEKFMLSKIRTSYIMTHKFKVGVVQ